MTFLGSSLCSNNCINRHLGLAIFSDVSNAHLMDMRQKVFSESMNDVTSITLQCLDTLTTGLPRVGWLARSVIMTSAGTCLYTHCETAAKRRIKLKL